MSNSYKNTRDWNRCVRAVGWSPACAGERASARADAQRKRSPAPISIGKFS